MGGHPLRTAGKPRWRTGPGPLGGVDRDTRFFGCRFLCEADNHFSWRTEAVKTGGIIGPLVVAETDHTVGERAVLQWNPHSARQICAGFHHDGLGPRRAGSRGRSRAGLPLWGRLISFVYVVGCRKLWRASEGRPNCCQRPAAPSPRPVGRFGSGRKLGRPSARVRRS